MVSLTSLVTETAGVQIANVGLRGSLGYWVCVIILSEKLIWLGIIGSVLSSRVTFYVQVAWIASETFSPASLLAWH